MKKSYLFVLFFVLIIVIFSVQNASTVDIAIFKWELSLPLSILIIISFIFGALFTIISSYFTLKKKRQIISEKENIITEKDKKIKELEKAIEETKLLNKQAKSDIDPKSIKLYDLRGINTCGYVCHDNRLFVGSLNGFRCKN